MLSALNIVAEKEIGTIEQINVSPVSKRLFILAKLMPNWIIGFIALAFGMTFGWLVHGVAPVGNLLTILLFTLVYVFVTTGIGMVISNYSDTMQQAMFVMFFFLVIMSIVPTPINTMAMIFFSFSPSFKKMTARIIVRIVLDLSIGVTLFTSPSCNARK